MAVPKALVPFLVGLTVVSVGISYGFNCGYAINPARDLGPRAFTAIAGWGRETFSIRNYNWFWVPIVGPYIGACLGVLVYKLAVGLHWPPPSPSPPSRHSSLDVQVSTAQYTPKSAFPLLGLADT